ncbi:Guanine nucleotide-binding protein alpha-3 subunit [Venturia inaequalis]|nr:Guanine nucleotide-binding protein alpha-3 subunit [Venturia inaequalis]
MKLSYPLLVALLAASVSAKKHSLCCYAGFNACNQFVCDDKSTQNIVDSSKGRYSRSKKSWDKDSGAPCGGLTNWMYANGKDKGDDGLLGGNEVSDLYQLYLLSSRCFNPKKPKDGLKIKGRQVHDEKVGIGDFIV